MLVKNWMSKEIVSVRIDDTVQHAAKMQEKNNAAILLVFDDTSIVGVVTDQDIKKASFPEFVPMDKDEAMSLVSDITVKHIMTRHPITVTLEHTMDEVAEILLKNKISAAPVTGNDGKTAGIISLADVLKFLMSVTGGDKIGYQLNFNVPDKAGLIDQVISIIKDYDGRVWNISCSYHKVPSGFRNVSMRIYNLEQKDISVLLNRVKEKTNELYVVDYVDNSRGMV